LLTSNLKVIILPLLREITTSLMTQCWYFSFLAFYSCSFVKLAAICSLVIGKKFTLSVKSMSIIYSILSTEWSMQKPNVPELKHNKGGIGWFENNLFAQRRVPSPPKIIRKSKLLLILLTLVIDSLFRTGTHPSIE